MISTVEKVLFLKSIDLFSQIPGEDLTAVALISSEERRDPGDEIFAEGESGDALYLVIDGKVRVHKQDRVIADLNDMVVLQWRKIEAMERRLGELREEFDAARLSGANAPEPPPPHY
jgi:uncharacterized coiled-coil protein SlyX